MGKRDKCDEVLWITCQGTERPIRQSTSTTKKMKTHRILSLEETVELSAEGIPSCKMQRTIWPQWPTVRLTLPL
jgi:hypothetical protein